MENNVHINNKQKQKLPNKHQDKQNFNIIHKTIVKYW